MEVDNLASFFETVEFFQDGDRDDDVVFVEVVEAGAVVQDYVGVEDKDLLVPRGAGPWVELMVDWVTFVFSLSIYLLVWGWLGVLPGGGGTLGIFH